MLRVRMATLDDVILALRILRKRGGEGRVFARVIGDWFKYDLRGYAGFIGDELAALILGEIGGHYIHIKEWITTSVCGKFDPMELMFQQFRYGLDHTIKAVNMTVSERDLGTAHQLHHLGFKAMKVRKNWDAPGHDGILFQYPMGRFD